MEKIKPYNLKRQSKNPDADELQAVLYKKMPPGHFLSNQTNCDRFLRWNTFYKRNLHRFVIDYLGINLYLYQAIMIYMMGVKKSVTIVATRSAAKSFIIAIYSCCMAILNPGIKIVITSATKGQSRLIIAEKIVGELMPRSPNLRREIKTYHTALGQDMDVIFKNGSVIKVVPASENARGYRSNLLIFEEFRQISKKVVDKILMPLQVVYKPECAVEAGSKYSNYSLDEINVYISSSWIDDGHWMWDNVDHAIESSLQDNGDSICLAFDESIVLKHKIKSKSYMKKSKETVDPLSWRTEFLNERVKDNDSSLFPYSIFKKNQKLYQPFYPRTVEDIVLKKKNHYFIPKVQNEVRIVSVDMAFVQNKKNDNSIFTCMRLLPESKEIVADGESKEISNGYRRIVSYIESIQGGDVQKQALRIRQLFEDFRADYIVLDTRNGGISVYDSLAKPMYDPERGVEYHPLLCMNNDSYAARIKSAGAEPRIYVINATDKLNSAIAIDFRRVLDSGLIDLPVSLNDALEDILPNISEYKMALTGEEQAFYEAPFLETQQLISECVALTTTKNDQTGVITVKEKGNNRKDRYTSVSYGSYFASELERDLANGIEEYECCVFWN